MSHNYVIPGIQAHESANQETFQGFRVNQRDSLSGARKTTLTPHERALFPRRNATAELPKQQSTATDISREASNEKENRIGAQSSKKEAAAVAPATRR